MVVNIEVAFISFLQNISYEICSVRFLLVSKRALVLTIINFHDIFCYCLLFLGIHSKVALMMILVAMPTQLIFAILCLFIAGRPSVVGVDFCIAYLLCIFALVKSKHFTE